MCAISYPRTLSVCRGCGEELDFISNVYPDTDWGERAAAVRAERGEGAGPIPEIKGIIQMFEDGEFFVSMDAVVSSGIYNELEPFTIIKVGFQHFEVMALLDKHRGYWIRSFSVSPDESDMDWLAEQSV